MHPKFVRTSVRRLPANWMTFFALSSPAISTTNERFNIASTSLAVRVRLIVFLLFSQQVINHFRVFVLGHFRAGIALFANRASHGLSMKTFGFLRGFTSLVWSLGVRLHALLAIRVRRHNVHSDGSEVLTLDFQRANGAQRKTNVFEILFNSMVRSRGRGLHWSLGTDVMFNAVTAFVN
jgi:hypothetical protein